MNSTPILIQPDIVTLSPAVNLALCASVVQSPTIDRGKTRPAATTPAALPRRLFCTEYRQQAKQSSRLEPLNGAAAGVALKQAGTRGGRLEMALAPVAGTRLLAPFRMLVVSVLANLVIEANQFEVTAQASTVADPKAQ